MVGEGAWGGRGCYGFGGDGWRRAILRSLFFGGLLGRRREGVIYGRFGRLR